MYYGLQPELKLSYPIISINSHLIVDSMILLLVSLITYCTQCHFQSQLFKVITGNKLNTEHQTVRLRIRYIRFTIN